LVIGRSAEYLTPIISQSIISAPLLTTSLSHTNWQTSSSNKVGIKMKKNILIRPNFITSILKSINSISLSHIIWQTIPQDKQFLASNTP